MADMRTEAHAAEIDGRSDNSKAELLYRSLFNQSPDGILIIDTDGCFIDFNEAAHRQLGYTRQEFAKLRISDIDPVEKPDEIRHKISKVIAGELAEFEVKHRTKSGEIRDVWIINRSLTIDGRIVVHTIWRDITERNRTNAELKKFFMLFENSADLMVIADPNGAFLKVNPACTATLGYSETELISKPFMYFIHPEDKQTTLDEMALQLKRGFSLNFENRYVCKDGSVRWLSWRATYHQAEKTTYATARDITELKKTQAERERFFTFFNTSNDLMCLAGSDGHFKMVNPVWTSTLGYTAEELLQKPFTEFIHPDDVQPSVKEVERQIAGKYVYNFVNRYRCKDGSYKWIEWRATPARDNIIYGIGRDITKRKNAEEARIQSDKQFRAFFDNAPLGIVIVDTDRRILNCNSAFQSMIGYSLEELRTMSVPEVSNPEDDLANRKYYNELIAGERSSFTLEKRYLRKDGTTLWGNLTGTILLNDDGTPQAVFGIVEDISERKKAEQGLRDSIKRAEDEKAMTEAIVAAIGEGLSVRDRNYRVTYQNQIHRDIIGDHIGELCYKAFHDSESVCDGCPVEKSFKDGKIHVSETCIASGKDVLYFENVASPVRDLNGEIIAGIELTRNRTESRRLQEQLETLNRTLAERVVEETEKNRAKEHLLQLQSRHVAMGEMINNIAHQWRQPLNNLGLTIQGLQAKFRRGELKEDVLKEKVKLAMSLINYMSQTITDFTNFYKQDKSAVKFRLRDIVKDAVCFMETGLKRHAIELSIDIPEEIVVTGHKNEYTQVVINILSNARDVLVDRGRKKPIIRVLAFLANGASVLTIADNGGGIPADVMERLFSPYFTTKENGKGMGIGLYISKTIIENNMQGKLSASNTADGAEFRIEV